MAELIRICFLQYPDKYHDSIINTNSKSKYFIFEMIFPSENPENNPAGLK
jgi:hypothetical protein